MEKNTAANFGMDAGAFMACDLNREDFDKLMKSGGITPDKKSLFFRPYGTRPLHTRKLKNKVHRKNKSQ